MLDILVSQVANGLVLGVIYVLIAVGLSITFGLLGVINFAHGAFFALGAYTAWQLHQLFAGRRWCWRRRWSPSSAWRSR